MRFLFTTLQFVESEAYGRVGRALQERGHQAAHVAVSRSAVQGLRAAGQRASCLPDRMAALGEIDVARETARIEARYDTPSLRAVFLTDPACSGRSERWCVERTVRTWMALEAIFDEVQPDVVVPEVGSESMRTIAHLIARDRGITTLFLFYTVFPNPLRLYVDTYHAPIVPPEEVRPLEEHEREEVEAFIASFIGRGRPILPHRRARVTPAKLGDFARHVAVKATRDRDNEYLEPAAFVRNFATQRVRAAAARRLYETLDPDRPFVYFPLHVTDDFKVKRVIPHCVDQAALIEQIADALPQGYDVVLKEHPVSLGRNTLGFLRRLVRRPNVRLVDPYTSSHELIARSAAVAVISSTVGLEALMHNRPVLTLGQPFYSGYGVTLDVDSFRELRDAVPAVLEFHPDRERILQLLHAAMRSTYPGAPAGVDPSPENARVLAGSIETIARQVLGRAPAAAPA